MATFVNLNVDGIPNGSFDTYLQDTSGNEVVNESVTYSGGNSQLPISLPVGSSLSGYTINALGSMGAVLTGLVEDDGVVPTNLVHLFLTIANSHTVGRDKATITDLFNEKVLQYGGTTDTINHPTLAQLDHNDTNSESDEYSPDLPFSDEYIASNPNIESMVFVPYAQGSSGFSTLWDPDGITGDRLIVAVQRYKDAKALLEADGKTVVDGGVLWHNGVNPDFDNFSIAEQLQAMDDFVAYIRAELGATMPIVFGGGPMEAQLLSRDVYADSRKVANFTGAGHRYPYVAAYDNTNPQYNTGTIKPFQIFDTTHCTRESDIEKGKERAYAIPRAIANNDPRLPFTASDYEMLFDFRSGTLKDWSGNGHDLTTTTNPFIRYESGLEQLTLDGSDATRAIRLALSSAVPQSYTIHFFYKVGATGAAGFIYNRDDGISNEIRLGALSGGTEIRAGHNGSSTDVQFLASELDQEYNLISLSYDAATTTMSLYANGVLKDTNNSVASHGGVTQYFGTQNSAGANSLNGYVGYCGIIGSSSTLAEVQVEYTKAQSLLVA